MARDRRLAAGLPPVPATRRRPLAAVLVAVLAALTAFGAAAAPATADPLGDKQAQAAQVASRIAELDDRMMERAAEFDRAQGELDRTNADIADAQQRVDATRHELADKQQAFRSFAVQAYLTGNDSPEFETLLTSDAREAPQRQSYIAVAGGDRKDRLDDLRGTRAKLDAQIDELEQSKQQAQAHADEMRRAKEDAEAALAEQQGIKSRLDGEIADMVRAEQERQAAETRQRVEAEAAQRAQAEAAQRAQAAQVATTAPAPRPAGAAAAAPAPAPTAAPRAAAPTNGTTQPGPAAPPSGPPPGGAPAPSGGAGAAVAAASSALGVPYVMGGASMSGFDCSGLTSWAWAKGGKSLPRTTYGQFAIGHRVSLSELQPGDLVFYNGVGHVGIYVGGGSIIHAPRTGTVVRVDSVYFWGPIDGAVRP